jgi:hypothetical protein
LTGPRLSIAVVELGAIRVRQHLMSKGAGDGPMMILLILVLLGLLIVAGFIVMDLVGEKKDETW